MEIKTEKVKNEPKQQRDDGVELENQFILRLPEETAKELHEALQTGQLKDRMTIKMDNDLRYGEVRFDHQLLHAKILDLPTVIECLKTIDNKSFYKSADICQVMICKEEPDDPEKESPNANKSKKKDPNKVDKKYLWPHGITPPCKNVRKRRFRKTLKKKNVEAPEIEKEVKRLLRIDNDAVKVEYEIINEDMDKRSLLDESHDGDGKDYNDGEDGDYNDETLNDDYDDVDADGEDGGEHAHTSRRQKSSHNRNDSSSQKDINIESDGDDDDGPSGSGHAPMRGVGAHDIFGEEVSSSEDEDLDDDDRHGSSRLRDLEDISRLSADDSRMSDFSIGAGGGAGGGGGVGPPNANSSVLGSGKTELTEFNKSMFASRGSSKMDVDDAGGSKFGGSNSNLAAPSGYFDDAKRQDYDDYSNDTPQLSVEQINAKMGELRRQHEDLKMQQAQKAQEISSIQNPTLKQRMQETLDNLLSQMIEKELEMKDYENML